MGTTDITSKVCSAVPAVPQIYAYTEPEVKRLNGWTKIGYTEHDVIKRIKEQTHTANVKWHKEWQGNAIYDDGSGETFRDTDFHGYLRKLDFKEDPKTEWFKISGDDSHTRFLEFRINRGIIDDMPSTDEYVLRDEQQHAIEKTLDYARLHKQGEFLWNAKPRFGKTLATYDLCKRLEAQKVLIVTNRPAIANSWYDDYVKYLGIESGYHFVSKVDALVGKPYVKTYDEYLTYKQNHKRGAKNFIEFVSLQDLKGSIHFGGEFDKLEEVYDITWDILIIDEAHEGVDTFKTDVAFDQIKRKFTLHLSGTPFKAIANEKFPEDAIFNWTYADEQQAKQDWNNTDLDNPYSDLPQLNMFTYKMSDVIEQEVMRGCDIDGETVEYAFDLNEFFATSEGGYFLHNEEVDKFLDALTTQKKYPFSTSELRDELRHTFWMLERVDSARALAKKLQKHPVFSEYEVILAAGDGRIDEEAENTKAFDKVRNAIATYDKTITLSVGQLTTGVTIPEWTGVLMLSNMKSPALYMQAAFRSQNPCLFSRDGKFFRKENAYVFDFDPARTLTIFDDFANDLYTDTTSKKGDVETRKQRILTLLNFFPVLGEDDNGEMIELDAERVLSIPRKIRSQEVVRRGFMSDFLFQNISNVFRAPAEVIQIIQNLEPYKEPNEDLGINDGTADELDLNQNGDVDIPDEQVIGTAADLFGGKVYKKVSDDLKREVNAAAKAFEQDENEKLFLDSLQDAFAYAVVDPLVDVAKEDYGEELKPAQQKRVERKIKADGNIKVNRQAGEYRIQVKRIEKEREDRLAQAETQTEANKINRECDAQKKAARKQLVNNIQETRDSMVQSAGEDIVREVETAKKESQKRDIESDIRDHLRGFSRTIPSFLMAYGDDDTTLENFDSIIPAEVFKEVTSITVEQFRFLRDGGDFKNADTGKKEHFDGHLFDPVVFDDSVKEFIRLRGELANYFDDDLDEDIFDYVPPQKTNQIYTPRRVVVQMVDFLEEENPGCFDDPTHTFADLYMKSGLYITEIIKRLYNSKAMKKKFPNKRKRLNHILENQVFGIAPTEIIYQIATHYILGYNDEIGAGCDTNFIMADSAALAKEGKLADFVVEQFGDKMEESE